MFQITKEQELQTLVDHSAALTLACAQSLQSVSGSILFDLSPFDDCMRQITHFANDTASALRDGLQTESDSAQGHADALRLSIVNRERKSEDSHGDPSLSNERVGIATHRITSQELMVPDLRRGIEAHRAIYNDGCVFDTSRP